MLSLMTLFSQSMAPWPLTNSFRTFPSTYRKCAADDRQHGEYGKTKLPIDQQQQNRRRQ